MRTRRRNPPSHVWSQQQSLRRRPQTLRCSKAGCGHRHGQHHWCQWTLTPSWPPARALSTRSQSSGCCRLFIGGRPPIPLFTRVHVAVRVLQPQPSLCVSVLSCSLPMFELRNCGKSCWELFAVAPHCFCLCFFCLLFVLLCLYFVRLVRVCVFAHVPLSLFATAFFGVCAALGLCASCVEFV